MLTVYVEGELNCDGPKREVPCVAPPEREVCREISYTSRNIASCRKAILTIARSLGWQKRGRRWLCPCCVELAGVSSAASAS